MIPAPERLESDRLLLRRFTPADHVAFAALNADPEVMRWFPATLTRERSDATVERSARSFAEDQLGLWAVERRDTGEFIGFTGTIWQRFDAPFTPAVEIGWRLAREHWGHGFAPEAAGVAMTDAFDRLDLVEIVSMTTVGNANSRRVMEKLGMTRDPADDFDHPNVAADSPLLRHVLYRIDAGAWRAAHPTTG